MSISPEIRDRLIFALDVPDRAEAVRFVKLLDGLVGYFKVGLELFVREGPEVVRAVQEHTSAGIFLDLKLFDIPATVRGALRSASSLKVQMITIHTSGGIAMLETAREVAASGLQVLGVTLLTSHRPEDLAMLGFRDDIDLKRQVLERARLARDAGCVGAVCSGEEVEGVKRACGADFKVVVPGIRSAESVVEQDDQARIVTPAKAIELGADHIVVGRPIRDAKDPVSAARNILHEIAQAVAGPHSA
ncbi:MAG: orotidine-5'-phosphate decarboxylase [Nitrospinae bacterium CG11_big_fil_rev_8_21_14_0_20_56_8]|nr:MAG: orotidine-5'-phosphate decarboxylase [Nitrospinae bacterium CG11_big_fil_rev_8_21_14_0_20_56_8]